MTAHVDRRDDVVRMAGNHDTDRDLAVIGRVGGVERAASAIEPHLASNGGAEVRLEIHDALGLTCPATGGIRTAVPLLRPPPSRAPAAARSSTFADSNSRC